MIKTISEIKSWFLKSKQNAYTICATYEKEGERSREIKSEMTKNATAYTIEGKRVFGNYYSYMKKLDTVDFWTNTTYHNLS